MIKTTYEEESAKYNKRHGYTETVSNNKPRKSSGNHNKTGKKPHHSKHSKKKEMSAGKKAALIIVAIVLCLVIVLVGVIAHYLGLFGDLGDEQGQRVTISDDERMTSESDLNDKVYNLMIVGVDSRDMNSYKGRSDSMIVISINKESKKMVMTSVLRDSYVSIPGHGYNKLNAAYSYGGTSLLCDSIEANYGIKVDNVAVVNFEDVANFVDALGGVDINLSPEERDVVSKTAPLNYSSTGDTHLNGKQAVSYARIRKLDNDFGRTKRQRTVLSACMEKVQNMSITEINDLITRFVPQIHTDLSAGEMLSMAPVILQSKSYDVESISIPKNGTWSDYWTPSGQEALAVDFEANKQYWESMVR